MVTDCIQIPPHLHCFCKMSNCSVLSPSYFASPAPCHLCGSPTDPLQFAILPRGCVQYYRTGLPGAEQGDNELPNYDGLRSCSPICLSTFQSACLANGSPAGQPMKWFPRSVAFANSINNAFCYIVPLLLL